MTEPFSAPSDPASGWAAPGRQPLLTDALRGLLTQVFGVAAEPAAPAPAGGPDLIPSALPEAACDALAGAVGAEHVRTDDAARAAHANGLSYLDLVRRREATAPLPAPDAVVCPADAAQVGAVLAACSRLNVAIVPFGGGTSVVGGVAPQRGRCRAVVALDLARLDRLLAVDAVSRTATLGAGLTLPRAEALLAEHGLTIGHLPQSFERATIGGAAATRSAGQLSSGWGRFDALIERVRAVTPVGVLDLGRAPGTAAGPDLRQLLLGGEGALGVICDVTVRVRPVPQRRRYEGWRVPDFATGLMLLRRLAQDGPRPDLLRLSDETETALGVATAGEPAGDGCLLLIGWEGADADVEHRAGPATELLDAAGAVALGPEAAERWRNGRLRGPRLRDELLDAGLLVETLETAVCWRDLPALHAAVGARLRDTLAADAPVVACHVSHVYESGAALYFSVLARRSASDPAGQWLAAKRAASAAIVDAAATITHHHGVGADHLPWMNAELGLNGVALLRAVKDHLDPAGILHPGVLVAEDAGADVPH